MPKKTAQGFSRVNASPVLRFVCDHAMVTLLILIGITIAPLSAGGMRPTTHKSSQIQSAKTTHRRVVAKGRRTAHAASSYQSHPDSERYQEIQKALADKGYFKGEANGQWGDDSMDALRRFQTDQHLSGDGKLDALTLTALGLGPKHDAATPK